MCQLMFAHDLKRLCSYDVDIEGYHIPEWGLSAPTSNISSQGIVLGSQLTRAALCGAMIDWLKPTIVNLDFVIFRYGNFCRPETYFHLFPEVEPSIKISDDCLLIHVRLGDVATQTNPMYGPLPIRYYEYLLAQTGLRPVFIGELDSSHYLDALKAAFPRAEMLTGQSPIVDFQIFRGAKNVALSVSSFAWMASFLSTKAQNIHLPLAGMFNPKDTPDLDLLPINDSRYVFHNVSKVAWAHRYNDPTGPLKGFSIARRTSIEQSQSIAFLQTFHRSARVHFGILRRMLRPRIFTGAVDRYDRIGHLE
jgi:hypothetical protein